MASSLVARWFVRIPVCWFCNRATQQRTTWHKNTSRRRFKHGGKKGGDDIGYSGHKHQKGEKELTIVDNKGFVICPLTVKPVNEHDSVLLPETVEHFVTFTKHIRLYVRGSFLTLDTGFDSEVNKNVIKVGGLVPVIYPNIRNTKQAIKIAQKFRWFNRKVYKKRYAIYNGPRNLDRYKRYRYNRTICQIPRNNTRRNGKPSWLSKLSGARIK